MELIGIIASHYIWLIPWLAGALVLGLAIWRLFPSQSDSTPVWPNPELAVFFTISTGLALQVIFLIGLAASHRLQPRWIVGGFIVLTLAASLLLVFRRDAWGNFAAVFRRPALEWLQILPLLLLIMPWLLRPLGPALGEDALTYHLPYARWYLEQGGLVVNETLRFQLHTHNVNLLYSAALIRPGATLAQMLHAAMGFLAMVGIYGMARLWQGWLTGVMAVLGLLALGEFRQTFSVAYVDNGVLLFVTAAFLALALWSENRSPRWMWLGALFAGTAMGTKYLGAVFTVPLGLFVFWRSRDFALTSRFALAVGAVGLFWYFRSWWISGNPVHPFAGEVFGHYLWTAGELKLQMLELQKHGIQKSFTNFWLLPFKMYSEDYRFNGATGHGGLVLAAFVLSCFLFHWQRPVVRAMQLTCLAFLIFWFSTSQVMRYLMIAMPLVALTTAVAFSEVLSRSAGKLPRRARALLSHGSIIGRAVLVVAIMLLGGRGLYTLAVDIHWVPLTPKDKVEFLARTHPAFPLAMAAAAHPHIGDGPILQIMVPEIRFFYEGTVYGDWMGSHSYHRFGHIGDSKHWEVNDSETLHRQVIGEGIQAVAMNKHPEIQFFPQEIDSYRRHFDFVLETPSAVLMIPKELQFP